MRLLLAALLAGAALPVTGTLPAAAADSMLDGADTSVRPGDDFWRFANGGWDKATSIPADKHTTGGAWVLDDIVDERVKALAEDRELAAGDPGAALIAKYYRSYLNMAARDQAGIAPVKPGLDAIDRAGSKSDLAALLADIRMPTPFEFVVAAHPKQPDHYTLLVDQVSLGMPDRDYYLSKDPKMAAHRAAYRAYLVKLSALAGLADAEGRADRVIALETALAEKLWDRARRRDMSQTINPVTIAELDRLAPALALPATLKALNVDTSGTLIAWTPSALTATARMWNDRPLAEWQDWMRLRLLDRSAPLLTAAFANASFDFRDRTLRGLEQQPPAWQRAVRLLHREMADEVARVYVARHLPPDARAKGVTLVADIVAAFEERLAKLPWMDAPTRKQALGKLAAMGRDVGAPEKFVDYTSLALTDEPLTNSWRLQDHSRKFQLNRVGKPVTNDYWDYPAHLVNGYYNFFDNRLRILAGFMQPPYFDPDNMAASYAGLGTIIGHEIGHGFDDQGRKFDATGTMRDWWSQASAKAFETQTAELVNQYNAYSPVPGLKLNGKLTLGENIGDLGGLETAYAAWRRYVARVGEPPVVDGLTGDQRFFLAYARAYREKSRAERLRETVLTDPHSPGMFRTNGAVRNVDAWYKAFGVKPGDKLYLPPAKRVRIW